MSDPYSGGKVLTWAEKVQAMKYRDSFNEFGSGGGRAIVPASEQARFDQNQKNLFASISVTDPYWDSGQALSDFKEGKTVVSPNGYSVDSNRITPKSSTSSSVLSQTTTTGQKTYLSATPFTLGASVSVNKVDPAKTAPIDTVLFEDDSISPEIMFDLVFEDIGGHELLSISRNDIINGQKISYSPIKNLGLIQQIYNPKNLFSLQKTSDKYFANFSIKFDEKVPEEGSGEDGINVYVEAATGDLIIETVNMNNDEQVESEISINGTIYEINFGETAS